MHNEDDAVAKALASIEQRLACIEKQIAGSDLGEDVQLQAPMTTQEAAAFLGIKRGTLDFWRSQGRGPSFIRCGRAIRYRRQDLRAWMERHEETVDCDIPAVSEAATEKQKQLLDMIVSHRETHGWNPTRKEMAAHFGVGMGSVQQRLHALHRKGYIKIEPNSAGGIQVLRRE